MQTIVMPIHFPIIPDPSEFSSLHEHVHRPSDLIAQDLGTRQLELYISQNAISICKTHVERSAPFNSKPKPPRPSN
jgi:hypothetical protein